MDIYLSDTRKLNTIPRLSKKRREINVWSKNFIRVSVLMAIPRIRCVDSEKKNCNSDKEIDVCQSKHLFKKIKATMAISVRTILAVFPIVAVVAWNVLDASPCLYFYDLFATHTGGWQLHSLQGKSVWITGASAGIGASLACEVIQAGAGHGKVAIIICLMLTDTVSFVLYISDTVLNDSVLFHQLCYHLAIAKNWKMWQNAAKKKRVHQERFMLCRTMRRRWRMWMLQ